MDYRGGSSLRERIQTRLACPDNQHEDAFGMLAQRPVAGIRDDELRRLIEPLVKRQIILRFTSPISSPRRAHDGSNDPLPPPQRVY
jgi:hypothetical protein